MLNLSLKNSVFALQFLVLGLQIFVHALQPRVVLQYLFVFYLVCLDYVLALVVDLVQICPLFPRFQLVRTLNILNSVGT